MDSDDLEAAVKAGVITPEIARDLRNFSAQLHGSSIADEERFGVVRGLGDVMTALGLALLLGGVIAAATLFRPVGMFAVAGLCWLLAEYFTRRRRLTLTSFALFGTFAVTLAVGLFDLFSTVMGVNPFADVKVAAKIPPLLGLLTAAGLTLACAGYWLRLQLPVAFAAAAVAACNVCIHVLRMILPGAPEWFVALVLLASGLALFAVAMWWDISDIRRETRRADIAFWLHCAAGYQVASASFRLVLGVKGASAGWDRIYAFTPSEPSAAAAVATLVLLAVFAAVALVIDRRSLLMSSLGFVFPSTVYLGGGLSRGASWVVAAMAMGLLLVVLAGSWSRLRAWLLRFVPAPIRAQLPRTELVHAKLRPVA